ncbi:UNVERIFIED_CONTAM: putative mitochondrial protein [Sesamum latifolium]|uniref:Mitochondrial protein n=1 Tax=Sesamum latifolium TaxID=2727402 RepID=A0AAW2UFJ9_9LAMI
MSPIFFQRFWSIVRHDVVACVLDLLNNFVMPPGVNSTHIVLIPKCKHREFLIQFKPINLCYVVYKIASKINANRLKVLLDRIISPVQSSFVPGRLITDNILLAFELNHFLYTKAKGGQGWMAFKLDVSKAYDKVEWPFLEQSFSSLLQYAEREGRLQGVYIYRGAPSISHLLFADDTLIFSKASLECTMVIQDILEVYRRASGQEINFSKSLVVFSKNTREDLCLWIETALAMRRENRLACYLGLPSRITRSKRTFLPLFGINVWARISGWNAKLPSQVGREVLIKSVIQAIPTYAMGCFKLPVTLLREIQSMVSKFWWSNENKTRLTGFRGSICVRVSWRADWVFDSCTYLITMLAKQLWRLWCHPEKLLSRVLRARYFSNRDLFLASLGTRPSFTWRSIFAAHNLSCARCRWRVGSGSSVNIWKDPWVPRPCSFRPITPFSPALAHLRIANLIEPSCSDWRVDLVRSIFWPCDNASIPLSRLGDTDQLVWHYSKSGTFSKVREQRVPSLPLHILVTLVGSKSLQHPVPRLPSKHLPRGRLRHRGQSRSTLMEPLFMGGAAVGLGAVARGGNGECLAWLSRRVARAGDVEMAEALVAREAIQLACRRGWNLIVIEGDCANLVCKLQASQRDVSSVGPIVFDILYLATTFISCQLGLVRRSGNSVSNFFARSALGVVEGGSVVPQQLLVCYLRIIR